MSSENERLQNSSESEARKRPGFPYSTDEKRPRSIDDINEIKHGSMRYFSPPPQMVPRQMMEASMNRPGMPRPISPRAGQPEDSDLTDAMVFLNKIKDEYADNLHVYDNFLETMRDFKFEKIDADEVCKAIRILFKDKPYLVRLFDEYLPHHLRFNDSARPYDMQQDRHKFSHYRGHTYMSNPPTPMHMGQIPSNTNIHMNRLSHPIVSSSNYMGGRPLRPSPPSPMAMPPETAGRAKPTPLMEIDSPKHKMANEFVQLVKKKYLAKPAIYKQFVELLQNSKTGFEKLFSQVSALLSETPDLVEIFERNFRSSQQPNEPIYTPEIDPLCAIKQDLANKGVKDQFLKAINCYNGNLLTLTDLVDMFEPIIDDKEHMMALKSFVSREIPSSDTEINKYKKFERIGSYRIFPTKIQLSTFSPLAKEVLNSMCVSVSTHESEEDTYVFRNKNNSEEHISRIVDERSESDLLMDRLKFLIVRLEELYEGLGDDELDMDDIQMSSALVKETLKSIYDTKSSEMLEAILTCPRKAIPVILKRLNKVYKNNSAKIRGLKKYWNSIIDEHYYRAYDTKGVSYRSQEKNCLSLKYIQSKPAGKYTVQIVDNEILEFIKELFRIFVKKHGSNGSRRIQSEEQFEIFDSVVADLMKDSLNAVVKFEMYALYYFILTLYTRFYEIKQISFEKIESNPIAVSIGLQQEFCIENRYEEIANSARLLVGKEIEPDMFEECVRRMSDSMGYKLYNLKKIMSKIERLITSLIDDESEIGEDDADDVVYSLLKSGDVVTIFKNKVESGNGGVSDE